MGMRLGMEWATRLGVAIKPGDDEEQKDCERRKNGLRDRLSLIRGLRIGWSFIWAGGCVKAANRGASRGRGKRGILDHLAEPWDQGRGHTKRHRRQLKSSSLVRTHRRGVHAYAMHVPQTLHPSVPYMHTYVVLCIDGVTSGYLSTSTLNPWEENSIFFLEQVGSCTIKKRRCSCSCSC